MKNVSVKKMNGKGKNAFRAVLIVVVLIFATCFALAACATGEDVQIEKVTSASEINRLIAKTNFTAENAVRDKMKERYGVLSDYSYNDGRATADIEKDGKSYSVTVEIDNDDWRGVSVSEKDTVEIRGEVDKDFMNFEIDVDSITKK